MNFREFLKENIVLFDGGMGTLLQQRGLKAGQLPERMNITERDVITEIHTAYFDAGSNVVTANTFGASSLKFSDDELEDIIKAAIENVKEAAQKSVSKAEKFVALDIGPLGRLLKPLGDLDFEEAVKIFAKTVTLGEKYGADLIIIETMNDSYETKAAVLCKNHDKGAVTRKECKTGCIGCMKCVKACEAGAVTIDKFCAKVDYEKCTGCGKCASVCPVHCIHEGNFICGAHF